MITITIPQVNPNVNIEEFAKGFQMFLDGWSIGITNNTGYHGPLYIHRPEIKRRMSLSGGSFEAYTVKSFYINSNRRNSVGNFTKLICTDTYSVIELKGCLEIVYKTYTAMKAIDTHIRSGLIQALETMMSYLEAQIEVRPADKSIKK